MEKHLFNLKFASKEMSRNARRCDKEEKLEKEKCKRSLRQGNIDGARIHAENAIRQRNQSLNFLKMSSRLDGVASKVQHAVTMRSVTSSMQGVSKAMDMALRSMNIEKITVLMDKFEKQFEEMDVQTAVVDSFTSQATSTMVPEEQVNSLMSQIAEEAGLELRLQLPSEQTDTIGSTAPTSVTDELAKRLMALRNTN
ncbi:charged multivesicular body protein 1b-like [Periplaneta americana]|uniref:charged multivesicular body protein 1b-like n=1 Tax=Periplaneta americana TaxID=6978 RepID=UPI0037E7D19E